ncbi:hypothetical protein FQA39_LY13577 [Lamprigera yunnana]|nr:hypothetical protein FQA39_LY13577 [Lamprigera yunnana]
MKLTEGDRIEILIILGYGDRRKTYQDTSVIFKANSSEKAAPIKKSVVQKTHAKWFKHRSVKDMRQSGRPKTATDLDMSIEQRYNVRYRVLDSDCDLFNTEQIQNTTIYHKNDYAKALSIHKYKKIHVSNEVIDTIVLLTLGRTSMIILGLHVEQTSGVTPRDELHTVVLSRVELSIESQVPISVELTSITTVPLSPMVIVYLASPMLITTSMLSQTEFTKASLAVQRMVVVGIVIMVVNAVSVEDSFSGVVLTEI